MLILASRINPPKVNEKKKFVSFCFRIFDSISRNMALYNSSNGEIHVFSSYENSFKRNCINFNGKESSMMF